MAAPSYSTMLELLMTSEEQRRRSAYIQQFQTLTLDDLATGGVASLIYQSAYADLISTNELSTDERALFRRAVSHPQAMNAGMQWYRANFPPFDQIASETFWPPQRPPIAVPVLMIWGSDDPVFGEQALELAGKAGDNVDVLVIAGAGHWLTFAHDDEVSEALAEFAGKVSR